MKRRLPPFAGLRAFEAAARLMSFKDAAEELCVTPSAVSHQIRTLEDFVGRPLFLRDHGHVELTRAGADYLSELTDLLDQLDDSTRRVCGDGPAAPLRIHSTPAFAARWMTPRLHRFACEGGVSISTSHGAPCVDFARNDADVVVHWGDSPVEGAVVEPFMEAVRFPVASPEYAARNRLNRPEDLRRIPLIHDEVQDCWALWFDCAGVAPPALPAGPTFANCDLTLGAAEHQQGVSLAYDQMARGALETGRLIRLFDIETRPFTIYSIAWRDVRRPDPRILAFRDWVLAEYAETLTAPVMAAE